MASPLEILITGPAGQEQAEEEEERPIGGLAAGDDDLDFGSDFNWSDPNPQPFGPGELGANLDWDMAMDKIAKGSTTPLPPGMEIVDEYRKRALGARDRMSQAQQAMRDAQARRMASLRGMEPDDNGLAFLSFAAEMLNPGKTGSFGEAASRAMPHLVSGIRMTNAQKRAIAEKLAAAEYGGAQDEFKSTTDLEKLDMGTLLGGGKLDIAVQNFLREQEKQRRLMGMADQLMGGQGAPGTPSMIEDDPLSTGPLRSMDSATNVYGPIGAGPASAGRPGAFFDNATPEQLAAMRLMGAPDLAPYYKLSRPSPDALLSDARERFKHSNMSADQLDQARHRNRTYEWETGLSPVAPNSNVSPSSFPRETPAQAQSAAQRARQILEREAAEQTARTGRVDPELQRELQRNAGQTGALGAQTDSEAASGPQVKPAAPIPPKAAAEIAAKREEARPAQEASVREARFRLDAANRNIDKAMTAINEAVLPATGIMGETAAKAGAPNARRLRAALDTLKNQLGVDTLLAFKAASSTGASGFGSLTEKEFERLSGLVESLDQGLDDKTLKGNLNEIRKYMNRLHGDREERFESTHGAPAGGDKPERRFRVLRKP
jgi:hypothetical protein